MSNEFHGYNGGSKHTAIFESRPVAVTLDEVQHIMTGMFSTGDSRLMDCDDDDQNRISNTEKYSSKLAANEIKQIINEWEQGITKPCTHEELLALEEKNNQAHIAFLSTIHPDNMTDDFMDECELNLSYRNAMLWDGHGEYADRIEEFKKFQSQTIDRQKKRKRKDTLVDEDFKEEMDEEEV